MIDDIIKQEIKSHVSAIASSIEQRIIEFMPKIELECFRAYSNYNATNDDIKIILQINENKDTQKSAKEDVAYFI